MNGNLWGIEKIVRSTAEYLFDHTVVQGTRYTANNTERNETLRYLRTLSTRDRAIEEKANAEAFYLFLQRSPTLKTTTLGIKLIGTHYEEKHKKNSIDREVTAVSVKIKEFLRRHNRIVMTDQRVDALEQWLIDAFRAYCPERRPFPRGQANLVVTAIQPIIGGKEKGSHIITPYTDTPQALALLMQKSTEAMLTAEVLQRLKDADVRIYGAAYHEDYRLWFTTQEPEHTVKVK